MRRSPRSLLLLLLCLGAGFACQGPGVAPAPTDVREPVAAGDGLVVERLVVGRGRANCYVVSKPPSRQAVVIDPGAEPERILAFLEARDLACSKIALTHGHADHVGAALALQERTDAYVHRHRLAVGPHLQVTEPGRAGPNLVPLTENARFSSGYFGFEVLHTPGHSPGSVCLHHPGLLFTGDLLFAGSVGRTDLPGGDAEALAHSLHVRLAHLPDDTLVFPGHGEATSLGHERRTNPYLTTRPRR